MFDNSMEIYDIETESFETSRLTMNFSDETSFFSSNNSPNLSPMPCPISPCRSESSPLAMEDDIIDFNAFINQKPYSPARKKLNMDSVASSLPKSSNFHCLRPIDENIISFRISLTPTRPCKRSQSDESESTENKRFRSENSSPQNSIFSLQTPIHRKTISIMNVLTSSTEMLRKNRL